MWCGDQNRVAKTAVEKVLIILKAGDVFGVGARPIEPRRFDVANGLSGTAPRFPGFAVFRPANMSRSHVADYR